MSKYLCLGFIDGMLKRKSLSNYTTFFPNKYENSYQAILKRFQQIQTENFLLRTDTKKVVMIKDLLN